MGMDKASEPDRRSDLLGRNLAELFNAIQLCMRSKMVTPALVVLYSAIDIAGWLDAEDPGAAVRTRFVSWVDKYLLPAQPFRCTALELYAARCGVVHTFTADSDLTQRGTARRIIYAWGDSRAEVLQEMIDLAQMSGWVPVQVEKLIEGYRLGVEAFLGRLDRDPERAARVSAKAERFFLPMSRQEGEGLLQWARDLLGRA
jgi:hypothetical protein